MSYTARAPQVPDQPNPNPRPAMPCPPLCLSTTVSTPSIPTPRTAPPPRPGLTGALDLAASPSALAFGRTSLVPPLSVPGPPRPRQPRHLRQILRCQSQRRRGGVLRRPAFLFGAGDRDDVGALGQGPGQGDLRGGDVGAVAGGHATQAGHDGL